MANSNRNKKTKKKQGISPIILIPLIALVLFIITVSFSSFQSSLFKSLYPKPSLHAAGITTPTKLVAVYRTPYYANGTALTTTEVGQKFQAIEATPDSNSWSGYTSGPFLYYALFDETEGPSGLDTPTAQTQTCAALGKDTYVSAAENSVTTYFHGEFCQIHDSIVNKTAFDHDLNPATPNVVATEDWFLHDGNGNRLTLTQGSNIFYVVNPNNMLWRQYFIARLFRDLNFLPGQAINERGWLSRIKATGIDLDNVGLSWDSLKNHDVTKAYPKEFSSSTAFSDAVFSFVQQIHNSLHDSTKGYNYPLWANMIAGSDDGSDWDRYVPYLEGGMKEDFVLNWHSGPYSSSRILNQLTQAEKWIANGRIYLAVGEARYDSQTNLDADARFSLAAFLLVTDGVNGLYKVKGSDYKYFYDYPEYYYQLGAPKASKYQKSSSPLVYRRDFDCGYAELDITNAVGTISYTQGCVPGLVPTPTPTPIPTPSSLVTPSPIPIVSSVTLNTNADTSVSALYPTSINGSGTTLYVNASSINITYYKFDLSGLVGQTLTSAKLRVKTGPGQYAASSSIQNVKLVSDTSWSESSMTYNNHPALSSTILGNLSNTSLNTTYDINLAVSYLQPYLGQVLSLGVDTSGTDGLELASKEAGSPAQLILSFATSSPLPSPTSSSSTGSDLTPPVVTITYPINNATISRNSTITITANATDNVGIARVEFYLDGSLKCTEYYVPYTCNMKFSKKGTSQIQAKAYDTSNNFSTQTVTVNIH